MILSYLFTATKVIWNFIKSFLVLLIYILTVSYMYSVLVISKIMLTSITFKIRVADNTSSYVTKPVNIMGQRINQFNKSFFDTISVFNVRILMPKIITEKLFYLLCILSIIFFIYILTSFISAIKHLKLRATGARPITNREYIGIKDAFEEMCRKTWGENYNAKKMKLYVYDLPSINCHVFSNDIICVNKGVLDLNLYMSQAMLMHELGHIKLGHALNIHLIMVSSYFLEYILLPYQYLCRAIPSLTFRRTILLIGWIFNALLYIPEKVLEIVQFNVLRMYECQADDHCIMHGYIKGLYNALEKLEPTQKPVTIIESLYLSHPHLAFRLDRVHKEFSKNHIIFKK